MNPQTTEVTAPHIKSALAWGTSGASVSLGFLGQIFAALGITTWAEAAQFMGFVSGTLAALLTFCYLVDWILKRVWRPLFLVLGWHKASDALDVVERE